MLDKIGVFSMGATTPSWTRNKFVFRSNEINNIRTFKSVN